MRDNLIIVIILALAAFLAAVWISVVFAHDHGVGSWINQQRLTDPVSGESCCNFDDCRAEKVREVAGGYLTEADVVPRSRVLWKSQDGQWWRCRKYVNGKDETRCLIGPPPGS